MTGTATYLHGVSRDTYPQHVVTVHDSGICASDGTHLLGGHVEAAIATWLDIASVPCTTLLQMDAQLASDQLGGVQSCGVLVQALNTLRVVNLLRRRKG